MPVHVVEEIWAEHVGKRGDQQGEAPPTEGPKEPAHTQTGRQQHRTQPQSLRDPIR